MRYRLFKARFHGQALAIALLAALLGCERNDIESAGRAVAASQQEKYRDNVIENWQSHVRKVPECANFIELFAIEGKKYPSAASGKFVTAMQRIKTSAAQAECLAQR
jgi:hypothetical protein